MTRPRAAWTPPPRDGVSASRVAVVPGPWTTVAAFLAQRLRPGIDWPARLAAGEVLDASGRALPPDAPCVPGSVLWYWRALPPEPRVPFELDVLHQDEHLVVVDKPHFLSAIPGGRYLQETALVRLRRLLGCADLVPLHRLDRETAGVLMFSAAPATRDAYHALLRDRRLHKVYEAVAPWRDDLALPHTACHRLQDPPDASHMPAQVVPGEPNATTLIELIARLDGAATATVADGRDHGPLGFYRLTPVTGRRHRYPSRIRRLAGSPLGRPKLCQGGVSALDTGERLIDLLR